MTDKPKPTWTDVAKMYPQFVQWAVQKYGPLPDGPVKQADYERYVDAYDARP